MGLKTLGHIISTEDELRRIIPPYPKIMDKRILSSLDDYCHDIIRHSRLIVFASSTPDLPIRILSSAQLTILSDQTIALQLPTVNSVAAHHMIRASLYFLIPGVGHGLRVNGVLTAEPSAVQLHIRDAYVHCARAAARSKIWQPDGPINNGDGSSYKDFVRKSPFLLLKTMNKEHKTELSPRGDQPGFVQILDAKTLLIPERPGNKVAISLRNIMQNKYVELLMLIPGTNTIMTVRGDAYVTAEKSLLQTSAMNNKVPTLGIGITDCHFDIQLAEAIDKNQPWDTEKFTEPKSLEKFSKVLSAHMNGVGLLGKATTPVIDAIVRHDMKNLY